MKALTFYARKQHLVRTLRGKSGPGQPPIKPIFEPRKDEIVQSALTRSIKATHRRGDEENVDIQRNVRASTLSRADFIISGLCMLTLSVSAGTPIEFATSLAVTIGHILCVHSFGRNNEVRYMTFKHMSFKTIDASGPDKIRVVRAITNKSKMNQNGHYEESSVIPHNDAAVCSIGFIVLSLLLRWHVLLETVPDFRVRGGWYTIPLMPGASSLDDREKVPDGGFQSKAEASTYNHAQSIANAPVTYPKCNAFITKAFGVLGMGVPKKGHLGRVLGVMMADNESGGRERASIADTARWTKDACRSSYLLDAPISGLLMAAQYPADGAMSHVNLRLRLSLADKPNLLNIFAKKIFPPEEDDDVDQVRSLLFFSKHFVLICSQAVALGERENIQYLTWHSSRSLS